MPRPQPASACAKSAISSAQSSRPIDRRNSESLTPTGVPAVVQVDRGGHRTVVLGRIVAGVHGAGIERGHSDSPNPMDSRYHR